MLQADRYKRIAAHIAQSKPEHPLSEEEQQSLLEMAAASLDLAQQSAAAVDDGLKLLSRLACLTQDIDKGLPDILAQELQLIFNGTTNPRTSSDLCLTVVEQQFYPVRSRTDFSPHASPFSHASVHKMTPGVPTGVFEPIASSHQWPAVEAQHAQHPLDTCLKKFDSNWKNAEAQPELLQRFIEEEMAQGWVIEIPGGEQEARAQWPKGIAIGKLNVVQAEGKDPRMVLESSVCNVNPRCTLPERVCLPTSADVSHHLQASGPEPPIRLHVCHFGARFSAYCGSRSVAPQTAAPPPGLQAAQGVALCRRPPTLAAAQPRLPGTGLRRGLPLAGRSAHQLEKGEAVVRAPQIPKILRPAYVGLFHGCCSGRV